MCVYALQERRQREGRSCAHRNYRRRDTVANCPSISGVEVGARVSMGSRMRPVYATLYCPRGGESAAAAAT